jgi:uncharacterized membrane protein
MTVSDASTPEPADDRSSREQQPTPEVAAAVEQAQMLVQLQRHFAGPLPDPDMLAGYERVLPGAAERIFAMAERQAEHRQALERTVVVGGHRRAWAGLIAGAVVALAFLVASYRLIQDGHALAGTILGTVDLTALVTVFVLGRASQRSSEDETKP